MAIENTPGNPALIQWGHNYAQPSVSAAAIPEGGQLQRALNWTGDRNAGAFIYDNNPLEIQEYTKRFGDEVINPLQSHKAGATTDNVIAAFKKTYEASQAVVADKNTNAARILAVMGKWAMDTEA